MRQNDRRFEAPRMTAGKERSSNSWWQRLRFRLWLAFHPSRRAPRRLRVVLDTNTLVAARWKPHGAAAQLLRACLDGQVHALITPEIQRENEHILGKVRPPPEFQRRVEVFYRTAERIEHVPAVRLSEDPDDDKFMACALAGQADCLVSSDRHLLVLDGCRGLTVCSAREALRRAGLLREG